MYDNPQFNRRFAKLQHTLVVIKDFQPGNIVGGCVLLRHQKKVKQVTKYARSSDNNSSITTAIVLTK